MVRTVTRKGAVVPDRICLDRLEVCSRRMRQFERHGQVARGLGEGARLGRAGERTQGPVVHEVVNGTHNVGQWWMTKNRIGLGAGGAPVSSSVASNGMLSQRSTRQRPACGRRGSEVVRGELVGGLSGAVWLIDAGLRDWLCLC